MLPSVSRAAVAGGGTKTTLTLRCNADATKSWVASVDPEDVESFQLTLSYDPLRAAPDTTFGQNGVIFSFPFVGSSVIDAAAGKITVTGSTPTLRDGDVNIFEIVFTDLQPGLATDSVFFTVGGLLPTDSITTRDTSTNATVIIPSAQIGQVSRAAVSTMSPFDWDPDGIYNNGTKGGAGTWNLTSNHFDNLPTIGTHGNDPALLDVGWSTAVNSTANNIAVFGGNVGTGQVTVQGSIPVGGFQFDMPGYHLSGGTLLLSPGTGSSVNVEIRDGTATINTVLANGGLVPTGLTKIGPGTLVLAGANTYTGPTAINSGAVQIAADQNLGAAPSAATPGMLALNGGTLSVTSAMTLNANRGVMLSAANGTVDVAVGGNLSYAGVIAGAGGLTKVGPGALFISGNNSFTGGTTVLGGDLINAGSLVSGVTVLNGGRLRGGGSISGPVNLGAGGILHPSATGAPTTMNLGSITMNVGSSFELTLNSASTLADKLVVSNGTTIGNGAQLIVQDSGSALLPQGISFIIIDNAPSTTMSGFFAGLPDGSSFTSGLNTFQIEYDAGSGLNDVQLTVVPEPSSALLLTAALALGGARRLRSRRR